MPTTNAENNGPWDAKLQQFHGGQDWAYLDNFVEDFSVTTNAFGMPESGKLASIESVQHSHHYPPADQEPAKTSLARFLWPAEFEVERDRLILGNGASELIDLVIRMAPAGTWKPGPFHTQYKEYERSARNNNFKLLPAESTDKATVACLVNPCNPTGDYLDLPVLKQWIEDNVLPGGYALVDESMQPWHSPEFRDHSLISQRDYVEKLFREKGISVFVMHSWTKLWCCTGLRLGSVICPTAEHMRAIKKLQVPWSVNTVALAFLNAVVSDDAYLHKTWQMIPVWRRQTIDRLSELFPEWKFHGRSFLSWIWVDTGSEDAAQKAIDLARAAGVPIRSGRPGYSLPTFIRLAVREPEKVDALIGALKAMC
ncbi:pyridoxal phosphate-dependent transferase [Coemansia spiralis]|nr:pyridoxal phosphate-dependent transferase [Coemansia spiralis]